MAIYSIGDLHGRYDLWKAALKKINFNQEEDTLYILGDVINRNLGGLQILNCIMGNPQAYRLILGNHEEQFLNNLPIYDRIMHNAKIKRQFKNVLRFFIRPYEEIAEELAIEAIRSGKKLNLKNNVKIKKWSTISKQRERLLQAIVDLLKVTDYDKEFVVDLTRVMLTFSRGYTTRPFLQEVFALDKHSYESLKKYLKSCLKEYKFTLNEKDIWLIHTLPIPNRTAKLAPDMNMKNTYIFFGHDPVPKLFRQLHIYNFEFNYREVLSYQDQFLNKYYNLDLGDNVVAVVDLATMEEKYVLKYRRNPKKAIAPPETTVQKRKVGYRMVTPGKRFGNDQIDIAFVTFTDYCFEYLIAIDTSDKKIYYKHISHLAKNIQFAIELIDQQIDKNLVLERVRKDFEKKKYTDEVIHCERVLRGLVTEE